MCTDRQKINVLDFRFLAEKIICLWWNGNHCLKDPRELYHLKIFINFPNYEIFGPGLEINFHIV